jgi:hypothetical protein
VWFHQLLIEVTWAAAPWLLFILLSSVGESWSLTLTAASTLLVLLLGSAGFLHAYLPGIAILMVIFGISIVGLSRYRGPAIIRVLVVAGSMGVGVAWWLLPSLPVVATLLSSAAPDASLAELRFASQFTSLPNVLSLTAVPILHQSVDGTPYISWSTLILNQPGMLLSFVFPSVAVLGAVYGSIARRSRMVAIPLVLSAGFGAFLSKGLNPPFSEVNLSLLSLPLGDVFRHPLDKFSVLFVLPMSVLFALGMASMSRYRLTRPLSVFAALVTCGYIALPWWTGAVIPIGGGRIPSAFVDVPLSYETAGQLLATSPAAGKTMVLPYSPDGGSAFLWKSGIQPNLDCLLEDWSPDRSLLCNGSGQKLADLVPSTLSGAMLAHDPRVFDLARVWGIDRWLVHRDWEVNYFPTSLDPAAAIAFMLHPEIVAPSSPPINRQNQALSLGTNFHPLVFLVRASASPPPEDAILRIGSVDVVLNRASASQPSAYVALKDQTHNLWYPGDGAVFPSGVWHQVTVSYQDGRLYLAVDGAAQGALSTCQDDGCHPTGQQGMPLTLVPHTFQVLAPKYSPGGTDMTLPTEQAPIARRQTATSSLTVMASTAELALFGQNSLPAIYAANSLVLRDALDDPATLLQAARDVAHEPAPVLLPTSFSGGQPDPNSTTSWYRDSATHYHGALSLTGSAVLVFLQTYDPHWALTVGGKRVSESNHWLADGYANAWNVTGTGTVGWTLDYELQVPTTIGAALAALLLVLVTATGAWPTFRLLRGRYFAEGILPKE